MKGMFVLGLLQITASEIDTNENVFTPGLPMWKFCQCAYSVLCKGGSCKVFQGMFEIAERLEAAPLTKC